MLNTNGKQVIVPNQKNGDRSGDGIKKDVPSQKSKRYLQNASSAVAANVLNSTNHCCCDKAKKSARKRGEYIAITDNLKTTPHFYEVDDCEKFSEVINGRVVYFAKINNFKEIILQMAYDQVVTFTKVGDDLSLWDGVIS